MALQLICRLDVADTAQWRSAFDADAEDQRNAGLTTLQIWHDADSQTRIWVLFEVNDRGRAEGWLDRARADTHGRRAGVTAAEAHFLRTA